MDRKKTGMVKQLCIIFEINNPLKKFFEKYLSILKQIIVVNILIKDFIKFGFLI